MGIEWGRGTAPGEADKPRKPRGSERPGHAHEGLAMTGMFIFMVAAVILGVAAWSYQPGDVAAADAADLTAAGVLLFGAAALMLVSLGLWLLLDLRTPILLVGGASTMTMVLAGFASPVFWLLAPTAFAAVWAGLSALGRHPVDRWTVVAVALLLGVALGSIGLVLLAPVALAAALVPLLQFGESSEEAAKDG